MAQGSARNRLPVLCADGARQDNEAAIRHARKCIECRRNVDTLLTGVGVTSTPMRGAIVPRARK